MNDDELEDELDAYDQMMEMVEKAERDQLEVPVLH